MANPILNEVSKETGGLTLDQIDAIDMEIGRAQALTIALHNNSSEDDVNPFLFPLLKERLEKISEMVSSFKIGGRS